MAGEFAVVIGDGRVFQADALETFRGSPETGLMSKAGSKRFAIYGPVGDSVLARLYVGITHKDGCSFWATPVVGGRPHDQNRRFFSRPPSATGREVAETFILPCSVDRGSYVTGLRGTSFGVIIERESPEQRFELESLTLNTIPLDIARGKAVNE